VSIQFDELLEVFGRLEVPISVSESHGLVCGLLSSQGSSSAKTQWFTQLLDAADIQAGTLEARADDLKTLDSWFGQVVKVMNDPDISFNPQLPGEHTSPAERVRALGDFCAGFCYGVGLGAAGRGNKPLPADTAELINDFNEIDSTVSNDVDGADENTLMELVEYVRVGVLLIHEELRPVSIIDNQVH